MSSLNFPQAAENTGAAQPCVLPCDQVLQYGTAFPCLLDAFDGPPLPMGAALPCRPPQEGDPQALKKALIASSLMRDDLALYLCLNPDDAAIRSLYHLLGQKLSALQEAAQAGGGGSGCTHDIPLYPLGAVLPDPQLGGRILQFCRNAHGPMHLAQLHAALYTRIDRPIGALFGQMAVHNLRLGKLLCACAAQMGAAPGEGLPSHALPPTSYDMPLQSVIDGSAAAAGKALALATRTGDPAVAGILRFTQARMQVYAARARQAQQMPA